MEKVEEGMRDLRGREGGREGGREEAGNDQFFGSGRSREMWVSF